MNFSSREDTATRKERMNLAIQIREGGRLTSRCDKCRGKINIASTRDMASTMITTEATGDITFPNNPGTNITGRKAVTVVNTAKKTGFDLVDASSELAAFIERACFEGFGDGPARAQ